MAVAPIIAESFAPLVDLLFPPRCPLCGEAIAEQTGLCAPCWGELVIPGEPFCASCQRPLPGGMPSGGAQCAACLQAPPLHAGIAAGTLYNEASRQLVLKFKHGRKIAMAPMLARLIAGRLPPSENVRIFIPVPLHWTRLWQRGFNQSALLAGELAKLAGGEVLVDGLERVRRTPSLGGLGRRERERTLAGAIRVRGDRRDAIRDAHVVLVDDVLTSGATSHACVKVLKRAGVRSVTIACFARVLTEAVTG
ncbi:ComF family protein [Parerythrobacter lacustris]|uniref:ComF family protein n=1 Tax=Parerythrobacter lacustris TaxID=2969984 RepID=A0ABT1XQH2_9SPHN|nr:ComF family protein [Parerythrobacter lacustris]MCR2833901.1 ComF family protein [Parerythrobacter lacustris]